MKKITKKEFFETLEKSTVSLCIRKFTEDANYLIKCESDIINADSSNLIFKTVVKKQTNALKFSDGAWLYKDEKGTKQYYNIGNVVIEVNKVSRGDKDEFIYLGYYIK